jgi:hypothetical protein
MLPIDCLHLTRERLGDGPLMRAAVEGSRRQSKTIEGHQRPSEAIRGHQCTHLPSLRAGIECLPRGPTTSHVLGRAARATRVARVGYAACAIARDRTRPRRCRWRLCARGAIPKLLLVRELWRLDD